MTIALAVVGGVFGALLLAAAVVATIAVGLRTGHPGVSRRIREFNRAVSNPRQLRTAGTRGAPYGVVHHVGRSSGRPYATPIGVKALDDRFVILLPYGPTADWVRNVVAAGAAVLETDGERFAVDDPRIVPASTVLHALSSIERRTLRLFGIEHCLVLRPVLRPDLSSAPRAGSRSDDSRSGPRAAEPRGRDAPRA